jgi:AAA15 family ATPase/GTPase
LIKYFTVKNFRSIKNENILEFDAHLENATYLAHPIIGFAGANASGKTTVLQSLTFVLWFMQHSFLRLDKNDEIPCEPFYTLSQSPTEFHLIFAKKADEKIIDYEYKLNLTKEKVLREELNYSFDGEDKLVYLREGNKVQFGENINSIDTKDLRRNSSIISLASQFASQDVANACKDYAVQTNLSYLTLDEEIMPLRDKIYFLTHWLENKKVAVQTFLKRADVGIEEIHLQKEMMSSEKIAIFKHKIDNILADFGYHSESSGTLQFLLVLSFVLQALENGSVLIFDEIELKLHQNLVAYLLELFENPAENKKGAQLICSFHNTYFMEFLKPEQLWFAEKNDQGQTELFPAAAFKDLYQKDLEMLYRVGKFGAKPRDI